MDIQAVTHLPNLKIITPQVFSDDRGYFFESYTINKLKNVVNENGFCQDNESKSEFGTLRGLHMQIGEFAQSKLVRVVQGRVWDVAVDLRNNSPSYRKWFGIELTGDNKKQLYIPRGFAHGFLTLSETAIFSYKCDNYYSTIHEVGIHFSDETLSIKWPKLDVDYKLSDKDKSLPFLKQIEDSELC